MEATKPNLMETLDLRKKKILDLTKSVGLEGQKAQVVLVMDYSGSMSELYKGGVVQELVERVLPLGLTFDDNKEIDMYLFHDGVIELKETVKRHNIDGYVNKAISGKSMGATSYAPFIKSILKKYGKKKLFGLGNYDTLEYPAYVIVITDGSNDDQGDAKKAMIEASNAGIFFQFIGIGRSSFPFLEKLDTMDGRFIDNANFFPVQDVKSMSDDDLYACLFKEFPQYVKEARTKNLIK